MKHKEELCNMLRVWTITFVLVLSILLPIVSAVGNESHWIKYRYDEVCTGNSPLTSNIVEPRVKWNFLTGDIVKSPPTVGDINNDGEMEVVFGSNDQHLYALDRFGDLLWDFPVIGSIVNSPTIGDVDGDDLNEIVFGGYYRTTGDPYLYVLNGEDGSLLWQFESANIGGDERGFQASALLLDINDDDIKDVLIGSMDYYFYAFNGPDGTLIWSSEEFPHFVRASSPIGDIDRDGELEIVVVDNEANVRLYTAFSGSLEWEIDIGHGVEATPVLADVEGDGYDEIILFTIGGLGTSGDAVVLNHDGTELWRSDDHTYFYTSPTILDIDGDGLVDIIGGDTDDHTLVAYKGTNGSILWETVLPDSTWSQAPLVTADIDSDGIIEVIAGANPNLYCLNTEDGTIEWVFEASGHIWGQPTIADLEQDGLAEVLFGCYDDYLYVLENAYEPPVADAGENQTVYEGDVVQFDGSGSYHPDPPKIKVLHVSAWTYQNELQDIIDKAGASDLYQITKVTLSQFNGGNPPTLGDYDVVIFGISDAYEANTGLSIGRLNELYTYVANDGGIVWTHDSLEYSYDYGWQIETPAGVDEVGASWFGQMIQDVKIVQDHPVVHVPFQIGDVGDTLPKTTYSGRPDYNSNRYAHSTGGAVTDADIIIRHNDPSPAPNNFYLTVKEYMSGRVVVTNLGHVVTWVDGTMYYLPSVLECQVLANTLFWAGKGPKDDLMYSWDFDAGVDSDGDGDSTNDVDATGPNPTHIYGDNGIFTVTLTVTDSQGQSASDTCQITVLNVDPSVSIESATMDVEIGLRVAGRKYNDVGMTLYEEGNEIGYISIERMPGSPNDQMTWIPVTLDMTKSYSVIVTYTPEDPPKIGGNPVWIYVKFEDESEEKIHHTFNVQQSKKRDSNHWNHVEPWEVDLMALLVGHPFEVISHITDPGSDDETLTFTYGSQSITVEYLNNPPNPDPYPSPEVNPRDIIDTTTLIYEGVGTVTLVVKDDDDIRLGIGQGSDIINVI